MGDFVETLQQRAKIIRAMRRFFDERDFTEVETAVAIAAPAPEEHIDCPRSAVGFLRASPELQMKKLLAAGMNRLYQIGPCFREGENGSRHNPEFTMIEWYRRHASYLDIANDLEQMFAAVAHSCGSHVDAAVNRRLSVRDAYRQYAAWDPWIEWNQDRFDFDMATKIEPAIKAIGGGVLLTDYPTSAASLAKIATAADGSEYAERWEFYYDGMELANCFTELCDGVEQRRRFELARQHRQVLDEADYPLDEDFLNSLDAIGSAAGVALGVDRLVMVLLGVKDIHEVRYC